MISAKAIFEASFALLESCHSEARLNLIGKIALRTDVLQTLCSRLQMEQDRQLYPNIAQQEIREPLFIVGLPRSGTTLLHSLLAADPEHRCPLMWEVMVAISAYCRRRETPNSARDQEL